MSSILKALEKAEESNSTKRMAAENGLIRSRKSRPSWVMPGAVLCAAAVATLVTFAIMGGFSRPAPSRQLPVVVAKVAPAPAPAPAVPAPVNTVIETPVIVPEQAGPAGSARTVVVPAPKTVPANNQKFVSKVSAKLTSQVNAKVSLPATTKVSSPATAKVSSALNSKPVPSPKVKAHAVATRVQATPAQVIPSQGSTELAPAVVTAPARPEPRVSGIAWQTNGESSFAVVNGRAVLQGSTVDGFKVLEIHQDAVKFSGSNGSTFEVPLGGEDK